MTDPDPRLLTSFICAVWTESDRASTLFTIKQEAELNKSTNGGHSDGLAQKDVEQAIINHDNRHRDQKVKYPNGLYL